ncbi:uncharacterized protein N7469_009227 [Penicillium citrinum]|uniref:Uncharacterized protein n=1 Tax=Penicillium citrinum TaxID=5077 RepID=A0A9W9NN29_PENCI|nr:uncharacterized protein N7469_009227 [Penicillium citrinum]KAJ5222987.1 hypothetical protein N7469_009227 [Penicillium citrinum]KAK5788289.1 hypothetical protein VI817_009247 [Penicillium citrinum]
MADLFKALMYESTVIPRQMASDQKYKQVKSTQCNGGVIEEVKSGDSPPCGILPSGRSPPPIFIL